MAKVLQRPMFKLGGSSDGVGITSGFRRPGYAFGNVHEQLHGNKDQVSEKLKNPEKEKYGKPDLLWDMYRTSKDAVDWKDWITGSADLALERRDAKKLEDKERPGKLFEAALKGGKAETDYLKATTDPQTIARMNLMKNVIYYNTP